MIRLDWGDPAGDVWRPLRTDFSDVGGTGIYIVRQTTGATVVVGQGVIKDRLSALQKDGRVFVYDSPGSPLLATWATIEGLQQTRMLYAIQLDGIERYLAETLKPLIVQRHPDVPPVPVPAVDSFPYPRAETPPER